MASDGNGQLVASRPRFSQRLLSSYSLVPSRLQPGRDGPRNSSVHHEPVKETELPIYMIVVRLGVKSKS